MSYCIEFITDCLIDCFCCLSCRKEYEFIEPKYQEYQCLPVLNPDYLPMIGNPLYISSESGYGSDHQFRYVNMAP